MNHSPSQHRMDALYFALGAFVVWQVVSLVVANPLIVPSPLAVAWQMVVQIQTIEMWQACASTMLRALIALFFSFIIALPLSFLATFYSRIFRYPLDRIFALMQTVPNVCYIIMLLFWTSRNMTVILTGIFLLCPMIYRIFVEQLDAIIETWHPIWKLYPQPKRVLMVSICIPMLKSAFAAALKSASSLAFKVCVTSEILTGLASGIGRHIQMARLDLNAAGVLAWSIWLVLLAGGFEKLWIFCIRGFFTKTRNAHNREK